MKAYKIIFKVFGIIAAVSIALGAYWHIYTLGMCAAMVYALKHEEKTNKQ